MLTTTNDLRLFWTAYDPLDLASGSIDVLGFQRAYIALADKILPGFTTVTTSPRYLSMLCAAIDVAQAKYPETATSPVKLRQQRLAVVKSYERAWALACELATSEPRIGRQAVDGLRGVQSVRRRLAEFSGREKYIRTGSFNLLANQVRYGGIGAYATMLEDCHLASMRSLSLRPLGSALADAFPSPVDKMPVHDEEKPLLLKGLQEWGRQCHLAAFSKKEAKALTLSLRGGEEGSWEDDVRWTMLRLISKGSTSTKSEAKLLQRVSNVITGRKAPQENYPEVCLRQIHAALVLIEPFESLYQACQFLFDMVRAAATDTVQVSLTTLSSDADILTAFQAAQSSARRLLAAHERANELHGQTDEDIRTTFLESGLSGLFAAIDNCSTAIELLKLVLDRHRDVQQGKFDRGERKSAWVQYDPSDNKARLTAQRYQLPIAERWGTWEDIPWHPYRTFAARRFIQQCDIR